MSREQLLGTSVTFMAHGLDQHLVQDGIEFVRASGGIVKESMSKNVALPRRTSLGRLGVKLGIIPYIMDDGPLIELSGTVQTEETSDPFTLFVNFFTRRAIEQFRTSIPEVNPDQSKIRRLVEKDLLSRRVH